MITVPYAASPNRSETFGFEKKARKMIITFLTIIIITRFLVVAHI
jgi:hypothetical protein